MNLGALASKLIKAAANPRSGEEEIHVVHPSCFQFSHVIDNKLAT